MFASNVGWTARRFGWVRMKVFQNRYFYGYEQVGLRVLKNTHLCACTRGNGVATFAETNKKFYGRKNTQGGSMEYRPPSFSSLGNPKMFTSA